ncbi:MAG: DUF3060 domain-containing protein [Proteobacteria bacterium]|nr:DUF3060 domain-containing protein [Pseudomonadota bacterium]
MRTLLGLMLVLAPTLASADQTFNDGRGGTVDCKKDPAVTINTNSGSYTLKGACTAVSVNGNANKLSIESVAALDVNGNENVIDVASADAITTNGNSNKVTFKKGTPKIGNLGTDNAITGGGDKPTADKPAERKPAPDSKVSNVTVVDCAKQPAYQITSRRGSYKFTGTCTKIGVVGADNKLSIENVKELGVNGSNNLIDLVAADRIAATGSGNTITYKKGLSGAKPKVASLGKNNKIDQIK